MSAWSKSWEALSSYSETVEETDIDERYTLVFLYRIYVLIDTYLSLACSGTLLFVCDCSFLNVSVVHGPHAAPNCSCTALAPICSGYKRNNEADSGSCLLV